MLLKVKDFLFNYIISVGFLLISFAGQFENALLSTMALPLTDTSFREEQYAKAHSQHKL